ncbi:26S proteasome non-ATPase [Sarcoptes scabiei]|nr:26S proteasome non-ATPase [Sarcoptes scabiei]
MAMRNPGPMNMNFIPNAMIPPGAMLYVPPTIVPVLPPGLQALYDCCARIYPDQPNPLQVTAMIKYWLNGPDPLDYVSMYFNRGDEKKKIPPHWHYISFGLSDLYGDGRIHPVSNADTPSGFGFELTFRLKKEPDETSPPTWPAAVMQALAKYVYKTGNILCSGDHVSWHYPLDNSESRIQHMLMTEDSELGTAQTIFGPVSFIQIVGVCYDELKAAQQWNGAGVIDLMSTISSLGGSYLITDMRRGETIFELDPELREAVDDGIATQGSNLSGVSAHCSFTTDLDDDIKENDLGESNRNKSKEEESSEISVKYRKISLRNDETDNVDAPSRTSRHSSMSVSHDRNSRMSFASETGADEPVELIQTKYFKTIHLKIDYEAGILLPLALRGRLKHGRHFTFKNVEGDLAVTFVTASIEGSFVTEEKPYAIQGPWLQILVPQTHIEIISAEIENTEYPEIVSA